MRKCEKVSVYHEEYGFNLTNNVCNLELSKKPKIVAIMGMVQKSYLIEK